MDAKINWFDLREYEILYLKRGILKGLINQGINKAGSLSKLCIILNSSFLYLILRKEKSVSVKTLKKLLRYLRLDYNHVENKIVQIKKGIKPSIIDPKFPIDLLNPKMGGIIGHIVSDGCLYYDKCRKDFIRTKYCSDDEEGLTEFVCNIKSVFGEVHYCKEFVRNCYTIRFGSSIGGDVLKKAGVTIGKKYEVNGALPWVVKKGCLELKKSYLRAIFDDEGSVGNTTSPYLILSRNIHVQFPKKEIKALKSIEKDMKRSFFPTGHSTQKIPIRTLIKRLNEMNEYKIIEKINNSKPKILIDESKMLKNSFGIENSTYVMALELTNNGAYSVKSAMVIRRKADVIKFYKEVSFSLSRKHNKLKEALVRKGCH